MVQSTPGQRAIRTSLRSLDSGTSDKLISFEKKFFKRRVIGWLILVQIIVTLLFTFCLPASYKSFLITDVGEAFETTLRVPAEGGTTANESTALTPGIRALAEDPTTYTLFLILPILIMLYFLLHLLGDIINKAKELPDALYKLGRLKKNSEKAFLPFLLDNLYKWKFWKWVLVGGMLLLMIVLPALSGYYQETARVLRNDRSYLHSLEGFDINRQLVDMDIEFTVRTERLLQSEIEKLETAYEYYLTQLEDITEQLETDQDVENRERLLRYQTTLYDRIDRVQEDVTQLSQLKERVANYGRGTYVPQIWFKLVYLLWIGFTVTLMPLITALITGLGLWYLFALRKSFKPMVPEYYNLQIEPSHRDRAGGLARLGNLYLEMIVLFVIPLIVLGLLVRFRDLFDWGSLFDLIIIVGFVILVAPVIWIVDLILDTSKEMGRLRREHFDTLAGEVREIREHLHTLIKKKAGIVKPADGIPTSKPEAQTKITDSVRPSVTSFWRWLIQLLGLRKSDESRTESPDVDDEIKRYRESLDALEKLYPGDKRFPVFPFDLSFLAGVTVAQVLSILWVLFGLRGNEHFQNLLGLLFPGGG